jgi:transcriptional regulator with XRE-family HTH domain
VNTAGAGDRGIPAAVWDDPLMRAALRSRDIGGVFVLLRRHGVSQRRISALTGQGQSEISEICNGRQVMAYDVLARIADGLGCPRGLLGMAYTPDTDGIGAALTTVPMAAREVDTMPDRRHVLGIAAKLAVGAALTTAELTALAVPAVATPAPATIDTTEVDALREITTALWVREKRYGGHAVRDAVIAQLGWARGLLRASHTDATSRELYGVVADLLSLAGWASHDVGLPGAAVGYLTHSMSAAAEIDDPVRTALAAEQIARVYLGQGDPGEALKICQLAGVAASRARVGQVDALVHSTTARAHADMGNVRQALDTLTAARAALTTGSGEISQPRGFDAGALGSESGRVLSIAATHNVSYAPRAIDALTAYTRTTDPVRVKRRAVSTAQLATVYFRAGQPADAVRTGHTALELAASVRSRRLADHLDTVRAEAVRLPRHRDAAELARAIDVAARRG